MSHVTIHLAAPSVAVYLQTLAEAIHHLDAALAVGKVHGTVTVEFETERVLAPPGSATPPAKGPAA